MITEYLLLLPIQFITYLISLFPTFDIVSSIFTYFTKFTNVLWSFDFILPVSDIIIVFSTISLLWTSILVYKILLFFYSVLRGGIIFHI